MIVNAFQKFKIAYVIDKKFDGNFKFYLSHQIPVTYYLPTFPVLPYWLKLIEMLNIIEILLQRYYNAYTYKIILK